MAMINQAFLQRWVPQRLRASLFDLNAPLVGGGLLAAAMIGAALAAPLISPHDPVQAVTQIGGQLAIKTPYPPGTLSMPLGSDMQGRDMLSRLLFGARYTLFMCGAIALVRVLVGALLGILAGWYAGMRSVLGAIISAWAAVPSLFFAIIAVQIVTIMLFHRRTLENPTNGMYVFIIALSLTGWTETAIRSRISVQSLKVAPFVEAAYAIGLSRWAVLWRHVLPNLRDLLLTEATAAMSAAMLLVAELGFFAFFIGSGAEDILKSKFPDPLYAEWGSMLGKGLRQRSSGVWLLLEPLLAFTITILAFYLLSEGLRRRR